MRCAYGSKADDAICQRTYERVVPCIVEGLPVPRDIADIIVCRASNVNFFRGRDGKFNNYEWEICLSTACALYRRQHLDEGYKMTLEKERSTRSYLYGRLLAVANALERSAMVREETNRQTNAMRLMVKFSERPYTTWAIIDKSLMPYRNRLSPGISVYYNKEIQEIMGLFKSDDFTNNKPLEGEYLLAYYNETTHLYEKKEKKTEEE